MTPDQVHKIDTYIVKYATESTTEFREFLHSIGVNENGHIPIVVHAYSSIIGRIIGSHFLSDDDIKKVASAVRKEMIHVAHQYNAINRGTLQ